MARLRLFWDFPSDAGEISASSEGYQLGAENLQHAHLSKLWQTGTSTAAEWVKVDLGAAHAVGAFALLGHDLAAGDSGLTLEGNASDSWGAPTFSQAVTYRAGTLVEFFAETTLRWWRFKFTKASAGVARSAGRLLLGPYHEVSRNLSGRDYRWGSDDPSVGRRTPGGQLYADERDHLRSLRFALKLAPDADAAELRALYASRGETRPWLVSVDHDNYPVDWLLYGTCGRRFEQEYNRWTEAAPLWDVGLEVVEAK